MRRDVVYFILLLLVTDIAVLMDIPLLRGVLILSTFIVALGYLFLESLGLSESFLDVFLLSIGLGVGLSIFIGLVVNSFYFMVYKPLSLFPLLLAFNIVFLVLLILARNKISFDFNILSSLKNEKLTSPMIMSFLLPLMGIIGSYIMRTYHSPLFNIFLMMLVIVYAISLITIFRGSISSLTYTTAIFNISLSMALVVSLYSEYIWVFNDAMLEYYLGNLTLKMGYWSISNYAGAYNSCLSITIFPAIYSLLSGLSVNCIFKLMQCGLFLLPIIVFNIFREYGGRRALIAAILFASQQPFLWDMPTHLRTAMAVFFFALAVMVLLNNRIMGWKKALLFLIFSILIIFSHYSTAYLTFFIFLFSSILLFFKEENNSNLTIGFSVLFFTVLFLWFGQVTRVPFIAGVEFFRDTIASLTKFFVMDYRGGTVTTAFGVGVKYVSQFVRIISYYLSLGFIAIGIVDALRKRYSEHLNANLICLSFVGLFILFLSVVLPYVTKGYDVERLFYHILIFTAIFFVFGGEFIAEKFFRVFNRGSLVQWRVLILSSVLFLQFIAGTSLVYSLGDAPGRAFPEFSEKTVLDAGTVYKSDVYSALWVLHFGDEKKVVLFDNIGDHKFLFSVCSFGKGFSTGNFKMSFFTEEIFTAKKFRILNYTSPSGINNYYGYLSRYNVLNKKIILDSSLENDTLLNTINRIAKSNVIYDNGYSKILSK
ncbi:MAG: DUF2206 domain-containing protein [Methanothermobacter sp.]|nr:DUF2206 domain-containing protein [Methanothermobacter sp.]